MAQPLVDHDSLSGAQAERKKVKQVEEALEEAASGDSLRVEIRAGLEALIP